MATVILSPHFDDAVLSCWHVLAGDGEAHVVNVFAAAPPAGVAAGPWDALTGGDDPAERARERRAEDRAALATVGRASVDLPFLEVEYRTEPPADLPGALSDHIDDGDVVLAPAALGVHPDHRLVRDAALALRDRALTVKLYADLPHAIMFGWPGWVTGEPDDRYLQVERQWANSLAASGIRLAGLAAETHDLDGLLDAKEAAIATYRTQAPALRHILPARALRYELTWAMP